MKYSNKADEYWNEENIKILKNEVSTINYK